MAVTLDEYEQAKETIRMYEIEIGINLEVDAFRVLPTDLLAGPTINYWMKLASHVLGTEHPKIVRAREHLSAVLVWQGNHPLFVKHPD